MRYRHFITYLTFSILCILPFAGYGQNIAKRQLMAYAELDRRGEVYFSFEIQSAAQIHELTRIISISNVSGNKVFAYANAKEFGEFEKHAIDYQVETAPSELQFVAAVSDPAELKTWDSYPTYPAYELLMSEFAASHPDICRLITIGQLPSGRKLLAVKITDNPDAAENEPEFLYTSSMHGDETAGYVLMLHLIDYLLTNYSKNDEVTRLVDNMEIYINPLANPDGTYRSGDNTVSGATRNNAAFINLNRNYPDPKAGPHPDGNAWQPETVAFMNFAASHHFTMAANFHGGAEVFNYPWDTWPRMPADHLWWKYLARAYADTVHKYAPAYYMTDLDNGVTNGYAWYEVNGGRQDYMNYYWHCREATIEISVTKQLPANQLLTNWNSNYRSVLNLMAESLYGLHGIVTDSLTAEPVAARVTISGFDADSSQVYADALAGDYHRMLKGSAYTVTFSATGYTPKTFAVQVADRQRTDLNIQLARIKTPMGMYPQASENTVSVYPNPGKTGNAVIIGCDMPMQHLTLTDVSGKTLLSLHPDSRTVTLSNTLPSGLYLLRIETGKKIISRKLLICD